MGNGRQLRLTMWDGNGRREEDLFSSSPAAAAVAAELATCEAAVPVVAGGPRVCMLPRKREGGSTKKGENVPAPNSNRGSMHREINMG